MKTQKKYTPATIKDALLALAEKDGKQVKGFAFKKRYDDIEWTLSTLESIDLQDKECPYYASDLGWCGLIARIEDVPLPTLDEKAKKVAEEILGKWFKSNISAIDCFAEAYKRGYADGRAAL